MKKFKESWEKLNFKKWKLLFIFWIFILIFRVFYGSQVINFTQDQARDVWMMETFHQEGRFLINYGPKASVGNFYLAPAYYQVHYWLSLVTGNHPLTMHWVIILVESLTPILLFLILREWLEDRASYLLAGLYAVSPLATIFGTFAWNPNMIPFLALLSLYGTMNHLKNGKKVWIIISTLAVCLAVHFHYQSIVLVPFWFLSVILSLKKNWTHWKVWLVAIGIAGLILLPYLSAELNSNFHNTRTIIEYFTTEHARYFDRVSKPAFVLSFMPRFFERILIGKSYGELKIILGRVVFLGGMFVLMWRAFKDKSQARLILLYLVSILVMLRVYKGDKLDYYMSTLFVMPYLLLGMIWGQFQKRASQGFLIVLSVVIAFGVGYHYKTIQPKNNLRALTEAVDFLDEYLPQKNVYFLFHNDDETNIFVYGLKRYSDITHDPKSLVLVDVCQGVQSCAWDQKLMCQHDRGFTYAALLKEKTNYQETAFYKDPQGYALRVGQFENDPQQIKEIKYPPDLYFDEYGNDVLDW